jgi:amino acid transporter
LLELAQNIDILGNLCGVLNFMGQPNSRTPVVFLRESTGLVKSVSFLDSISLNISNMSAGAALGIIGLTMISIPATTAASTNLALASVIAFVLSIPQIIVYTMMTRRMPRTGGDYVWISRNLGGMFGSSISFMGYTLETLAYLALISLSAVFAIGSVGLFFNPTSSTFFGLAVPSTVPGATPVLQFALGSFIFAILIAINIFRPKFGYKLVSGLIVVGVVGLLLAIFTLLAAGKTGVENYMNNVIAGGNASSPLTYNNIVSKATPSARTFNLSATIFMLPFFAIFVYPWLNAAPAVASEIKGKNAVKWNVPVSATVVFALVTGAFAAMYYAGGFTFINAALANSTLVFDYSFNFWTLAMGVANNNAIAWFLGISWILWNVAVLAYGIIVFSRYLFAQAFDRFLPTRLATISQKFGSPYIAHVIDLVITVALIGAAAYLYGSLQALFAAVIASMIYFFFIGITAVVYANGKGRGPGRLTLSISGALMAAVFLFLISQFLSNPTIWGTPVVAFGVQGYVFAYLYVAGSFIAGLIIYAASMSYHRRKGIDITLAYKEIPPE